MKKKIVQKIVLVTIISLLFVGVPTQKPAHAELCTNASNIVSYWPADYTITDTEGDNDGTLTNGATYAPGYQNGAFCMDGTNDYVNIPTDSSLQITDELTVSAWVKLESLESGQHIIGKMEDGSNLEWEIVMSGAGNVWKCFSDAGVGTVDTGIVAEAGVWTHIALTYSSSALNCYINAVSGTTDASPGTLAGSTNPITIGDLNPTNLPLNGTIDEIQIYNNELSSSEINAIYEAGRGGYCKACTPQTPGLVSWWPADASDIDIVGGNDGTRSAGVSTVDGKVIGAYNLNGSSGSITMPNESDYDFSGEEFTITGWFKTSVVGTHEIVAKGGSGDYQYAVQVESDGTLVAVFTNAAGSDVYSKVTSGTVHDGDWHHFAAVMNTDTTNEDITFYLDGSEEATELNDNRGSIDYNTSGSNALRIGSWNTSPFNYFDGQIDEVKIFSRALTASEVSALYNANNYGMCKDGTNYIKKYGVSTISDTMSRQKVSTGSDHTITGTLTNELFAGQSLYVTFPGSTFPAGLDYNDVDVSWGPTTGLENSPTLGASASGSTYGAYFQCGTFILDSGTSTIDAGSKVVIKIGTNASGGDTQITNPATAGSYKVTLATSTYQEGFTIVPILDSDQATVTAQVAPSITFDIDVGTASGENSTPYTIPMGTLTAGSISTSDNSSVKSIFVELSSNADNGAIITVTGTNGGLTSTTANKTITTSDGGSATALSAGTEGFGLCVTDTNEDSGGPMAVVAPYNGTCDASNHNVGGLTTSARTILNTSSTSVEGTANDTAEIMIKAAIANTTAAANDYSETITFIAVGTY